MSNSVIDRNEEQQKRFGEALITFESEMGACCKALKGHIEDSRDDIQAPNAVQALNYLLELIEEIESDLPGVVEFGTKQKVLAKHISDASDFTFSRH